MKGYQRSRVIKEALNTAWRLLWYTMTAKELKKQHQDLERELEIFLAEQDRDPKSVEMLVSLQGE